MKDVRLFCYTVRAMSKTKRVLLALRLNYSTNRQFLEGVARYLRHAPGWRVTVVENFYDFDAAALARAAHDRYDGILTVPPHDPEAARLLCAQTTPLALLGATGDELPGRRRIAFVGSDERGLGAHAAERFRSLGTFRAFAFVMSSPATVWARQRFEGFRDALAAHGCEPPVLIDSPHVAGSPDDLACLKAALAALPKPLAVMAAYDQRGAQVLQACDGAGLSVPTRVQVIGVDDDPVFCDFSRPTLTSLSTSQVRKGEVAAMALDRLMDDARAGRKVVKLKGSEIVERESTAPLAPAAHLVERAMAFVERRATSGVRARDVVAHLGVSPALVSRRFREYGCRTLSDALARARLKAVRVKLRTTNLRIGAITAACGFPNADYAKRLFRKTYGLTMREYRRSLAAHAPLFSRAAPESTLPAGTTRTAKRQLSLPEA